MVDTYLIIGIVSAVAAVTGIGITNYWNNRTRKDRQVETRQSMQADVEETARIKFKDEKILAEELAKHNEKIAIDVKQDMKEHVDRLIVILQSDIELQRTLIYSKIDTIDAKVAQIKIDLMEHIINKKEDLSRIQKSIDFIQTMQLGPEAKSIPAYMIGEDETQEHKDEPDKGVFASRKDTTHKDTKDPVVQPDPPKETKKEQDAEPED